MCLVVPYRQTTAKRASRQPMPRWLAESCDGACAATWLPPLTISVAEELLAYPKHADHEHHADEVVGSDLAVVVSRGVLLSQEGKAGEHSQLPCIPRLCYP